MLRTLLIRVSRSCSGCGASCRYAVSEGGVLDPRYVSTLANYVSWFEECVILCSSPTRNRRVFDILSVLSDMCRKVRFLTPITDILSIPRAIHDVVDEVSVVVSPQLTDLSIGCYLKRLIESVGVDKVFTYVVLDDVNDLVKALEVIKTSRELGIRVRIGERPYCTSRHVNLRLDLMRKGFRVGLPHSQLFGYRCATVEIEGGPATVLFKDPALCNVLYLDTDGYLSKCPRARELGLLAKVSELSEEELRRVSLFRCEDVKSVVPVLRLSMRIGSVEVPSEVLQILELIKHFNSLRRACMALGLSPSSCVEKIKRVENRLGAKLVVAKHGGREGGATYLTSLGVDLVEMYERVRDGITRALLAMGEDGFVIR